MDLYSLFYQAYDRTKVEEFSLQDYLLGCRDDPMMRATTAERMIRAFHPRPGAWVALEGSPAKLLAGRLTSAAVPDGVIDTTDGRALLGLAEGVVEITRIQPAGRKPMSGAAFANGRRGETIAIDS